MNAWTEWFRQNLRPLPFQILHMRELAEHTVAAIDTTRPKVMHGSDQSPLPLRVDPADDADLLYATLVIFGQEVAEKIGGSSPQELRNRMWRGNSEPQGLPSGTPQEAFQRALSITGWLRTCAPLIAQDPTLGDSPDDLVRVIKKMSARYPRTPQFKTYRPRACPLCGEHTLYPIWGKSRLKSVDCDHCGNSWKVYE